MEFIWQDWMVCDDNMMYVAAWRHDGGMHDDGVTVQVLSGKQ